MPSEPRQMTRRGMLKALGGAAGALLLIDCGKTASAVDAGGDLTTGPTPDLTHTGGAPDLTPSPDAGAEMCVLDVNVTKGPYWVDEKKNRSDVTSDTNNKASPNPRPGLPLTLKLTVFAYTANGCTRLPNAQVDIWHCDATGIYSDSANMGHSDTTGQNFLRGYQVTDASGAVTFKTIYPGWYGGRTVHIHVKVRIFDANQNTTTEATTQLFFDDATTDAVFAATAPYNSRGARDTRNAGDMVYAGHTELLLALAGTPATSYTGTLSLGVAAGTVNGG